MPFDLDLPIGAINGTGTVVIHDGIMMLQIPLWRSYFAGCILLGLAPCTAMVLVWGYLADGNDGLTLVMVAINSLTMVVLYGIIGGFLLGVGQLPIPWQVLLLSVGIYVAMPLISGLLSRKLILKHKGEVIFNNPISILLIAIPLFIQTILIFALGYAAAKIMKLQYKDAAPVAMIGASNHFEVAIATAVMLFGVSSGAALATVVRVLIEVPLMLMLVKFCLKTKNWFD